MDLQYDIYVVRFIVRLNYVPNNIRIMKQSCIRERAHVRTRSKSNSNNAAVNVIYRIRVFVRSTFNY